MTGIPYTRTAQRPSWESLPQALRDAVTARLGAPVVTARSAGGGFTPGFAATLTTADGRAHFVKAAPLDSDISGWYATEARITAALPASIPTARLRWTAELADHRVLCLDAIDGAMPSLPWQPAQLAAALDAQAVIAEAFAAVPAELEPLVTTSWAERMTGTLDRWRDPAGPPAAAPAWALARADELAELEGVFWNFATTAAGLIHCDLRLDNVVIDAAGKAWVCDWNFLTRGPALLDAISLLLTAVPDHDVDALVAGEDPVLVDGALVAFSGYYLTAGAREEIPTSPHVRSHQRYYAELALRWLSARRP
ncbi:hypothetical protein F4553_003325 [Allocatelliglobosispora scoriae]|uniref:Aminoglycoside phosphotransferase domain-containing protein n=1 Tax=Allocatelliglobosispora scoriae TaxID=643052 RepID=A0A841BRE2_9ACTN|nr:phosphotransferase [Allocatelliglobosispora scoriae]MBB5869946.1 hypothetical protein [Allocatelliglobosispora scoriae]